MAQVVKSKPTKPVSKSNRKTNKTGNKSKKPAAARMNMIATPDAMLAIPLGEIPASLPKMNLDAAFDYDVDMHKYKQGKHAGETLPRFQFTLDGKAYNMYYDEGVKLGTAIESDPLLVLKLIAYARDQRAQAK